MRVYINYTTSSTLVALMYMQMFADLFYLPRKPYSAAEKCNDFDLKILHCYMNMQ